MANCFAKMESKKYKDAVNNLLTLQDSNIQTKSSNY